MELNISSFERGYRKHKHYFDYYNSADIKIEALETLSSIQNRFLDRKDDLENEIDSKVNELQIFIDSVLVQVEKRNNIGSEAEDVMKRKFEYLTKKLKKDLLQISASYRINSIENNTQTLLYEQLQEYSANISEDIFQIPVERAVEVGKLYLNAKYHFKTIKYIVDKAMDKSFPPNIEPNDIWGKIHQKERSNNQLNDFSDDKLKRKEEINKHYLSQIISEAERLINEDKSICITSSGYASSYLYKRVHRKLSDIKKERNVIERPSDQTVKNRINDYLSKVFKKS